MRQPSLTRQNDKVALVGMGDSMKRTPWNDPSFDLYGLNAAHRPGIMNAAHASLWFQIHRPGTNEGHIDDPDHQEWLRTWGGCPVLMCEQYDWVPQSVPYPIEEVTNDCGPGHHYYTSTVDFMMGYALLQGYKEIHLYGIDMGNDDYEHRKQSLAWYLGVAWGRGVKLYVPPESSILKFSRVYGFEPAPTENKRLIEILNNTVKDALGQQQHHHDSYISEFGKMRFAEGQKNAYQDIMNVLGARERNHSQV